MNERYRDPKASPEERARDLLRRMSIEEKLAQLCTVMPREEDAGSLDKEIACGIGQISTLHVREMRTMEQVIRWQHTLQRRVMERSPHGIPAVFHMEGLCGAFLPGAASFPSGIARGAGWDPINERALGAIAGRQERALGITQTLAPVLDINRDCRMGRTSEAYGEDPTLVAALGTAYTRGLQGEHTAGRASEGVAKHFLGSHMVQGGIHGASAEIAPRSLEEVHAKPFQAAISLAGLKGVMPCYCDVNGEPASSSRTLLQGLLREKMGFTGVCVSDYGAIGNVFQVQHVTESLADAGQLCLEAGMDVETPVCAAFSEELARRFRSSEADASALDAAVERVLEAKFRMGLFEHPFALEGRELEEAFHRPSDAAALLTAARQSLVLLKNDGILPIEKGRALRIAVVGRHAANARSFFGGYTHLSMVEAVYASANSLAGVGESGAKKREARTIPGTQVQDSETEEFDAILRWQKPHCRSLLEELEARLTDAKITFAYGYPPAGDDESRFPEALEAIRQADLAILTLGGKNGSCSVATMGEGVDGTDINLPPCQERFLRRAAALGTPLVGLHFDGRPVSSDAADECLGALIECWNPAEAGAQAIADVLTGRVSPSGRLPVTVAYHAGQLPLYYAHHHGAAWHQGESIGFQNYVDLPHTPRYPFGFGLSYTRFSYRELAISTEQPNPHEAFTVSLTVQNDGERDGDEVVQLYFRDPQASVCRPVLELAGFARVPLRAGESARVVFTLDSTLFAFLGRKLQWQVEKGTIELYAAASSQELFLRGSVRIPRTETISPAARCFFADAEIFPFRSLHEKP